jgi:hypothetical protein
LRLADDLSKSVSQKALCVRYSTAQLEKTRRISQFEADAAAIGAPGPSAALARLLAAAAAEVVEVMVARPIEILSGVSPAKDWAADIDDEKAAVFEECPDACQRLEASSWGSCARSAQQTDSQTTSPGPG